MNYQINQLLNYGLKCGLIKEIDYDFAANLLIDLLKIDNFYQQEVDEELSCQIILNQLLDYAVTKGIIEDTITQRDLFDTRLMACLMPRVSEVVNNFDNLYQKDKKQATDYFYHLALDSNYIRLDRIKKNIKYKYQSKYGLLDITINLSKPEKDPKEIARAKLIKASDYPKCLLCKENIGFAGNLNRNARQTIRYIPLKLDNQDYFFQYSPYVYYNEHCIIFNKEHIPMVINKSTFQKLFDFVRMFPHYTIGSNADLPIVGGSILTHDHFQGGAYEFPICNSEIISRFYFENYLDVEGQHINWPLSTLRLVSKNISNLVELSALILNGWKDYSDKSLDIYAYSGDVRHNTITPIVRVKDGLYQIDLVLRNNRQTDKYPLGIFHPHQDKHHIKKENIGLIEVMGLAVLPARLKDELGLVKDVLTSGKDPLIYPSLNSHLTWINEIKEKYTDFSNIDKILEDEVGSIFSGVLEDAGVFKLDDLGIAGINRFIKKVGGKFNEFK